jgi:hypothetical protein
VQVSKTTKCNLCEQGFPLVGDDHIPTQSLGMIPVTRCRKLPPVKTQQAAPQTDRRERARRVAFNVVAGWEVKRRVIRGLDDEQIQALEDRIANALLAFEAESLKEAAEVVRPFAEADRRMRAYIGHEFDGVISGTMADVASVHYEHCRKAADWLKRHGGGV